MKNEFYRNIQKGQQITVLALNSLWTRFNINNNRLRWEDTSTFRGIIWKDIITVEGQEEIATFVLVNSVKVSEKTTIDIFECIYKS